MGGWWAAKTRGPWPPHCVAGTAGQQKPQNTLLGKRVIVPKEAAGYSIDGAQQIILETAAVEAITAGLTDEHLSLFNGLYEQMISVRIGENDEASYKAYMERDSEFHLLFFQILGNQRLLSIYRNLNAHMNQPHL